MTGVQTCALPISALVVWNWFGKEIFLPVRDGGSIDISAAVEKTVVTAKAEPQIGLQKAGRFFQPQRFGGIDSGLGADVITGFVVLLDGVSPEPGLHAGVVVIQPPGFIQ